MDLILMLDMEAISDIGLDGVFIHVINTEKEQRPRVCFPRHRGHDREQRSQRRLLRKGIYTSEVNH